MYDEDDEFLRGIPAFLRRFEAPPLRKLPVRPRDLAAARTQAEPQPRAAVVRRLTSRLRSPAMIDRRASAD